MSHPNIIEKFNPRHASWPEIIELSLEEIKVVSANDDVTTNRVSESESHNEENPESSESSEIHEPIERTKILERTEAFWNLVFDPFYVIKK